MPWEYLFLGIFSLTACAALGGLAAWIDLANAEKAFNREVEGIQRELAHRFGSAEAVLTTHPDIQEAAIIGIPDEGGDETIKGFIVLREGATSDKSELLKFSRKNLDAYKRPRDLDIVEELPKNALQKVLKRELRKKELERLKNKVS